MSSTARFSEEQFATVAQVGGEDITVCFQTIGHPDDEPLLLVMGLGGPMIWWSQEMCTALADAGFFVIRYDHRDTGRSSRDPRRVTKSALVTSFFGIPGARRAYSLSTLADDAVGILDHLGIASAHVAGISMGGMVSQTLAIEHPDRVRSLTSTMSTTGSRFVGWQDPTIVPALLSPKRRDREGYIEDSTTFWRLIASTGHPGAMDGVAERAADTFDRGVSSAGVLRHMTAVLSQPNRTRALRRLTVPTTVIHGRDDRMVHVSGGRATAKAIPGAELDLIDGMGHDIPSALVPRVVSGIRSAADRA